MSFTSLMALLSVLAESFVLYKSDQASQIEKNMIIRKLEALLEQVKEL